MAPNILKCNCLTPLYIKGLKTASHRQEWISRRPCYTHMRTPGGGRHTHSPVAMLTYIRSCDCGSSISTHSTLTHTHTETHSHTTTSNVTGCHRGPKLISGHRAPSLKRTFYLALASVMEFLVFVVECKGCHIFCRRVRYHALSLCYVCIRHSGIILIP